MQCNFCEEQLEEISFTTSNRGVSVILNREEQATLFVCTSRDCKNCGVVIAIPWKNKDEEERSEE